MDGGRSTETFPLFITVAIHVRRCAEKERRSIPSTARRRSSDTSRNAERIRRSEKDLTSPPSVGPIRSFRIKQRGAARRGGDFRSRSGRVRTEKRRPVDPDLAFVWIRTGWHFRVWKLGLPSDGRRSKSNACLSPNPCRHRREKQSDVGASASFTYHLYIFEGKSLTNSGKAALNMSMRDSSVRRRTEDIQKRGAFSLKCFNQSYGIDDIIKISSCRRYFVFSSRIGPTEFRRWKAVSPGFRGRVRYDFVGFRSLFSR